MALHSVKDLEVLVLVLRQLNQFSSVLWSKKEDLQGVGLSDDAKSNYDRLIIVKHPADDQDFDDIESDIGKNARIKVERFYLPPLEGNRDFVPLLWIECDYNSTPPTTSFRVGMYRYLSGARPQCFGFRFEMHNGSSNHDYYHVQVTPRPHTEVDCDYLDWIPDEVPCILLPAKNPVALVFCMLISFYGRRIAQKMISPMNIDGKYMTPLNYLEPHHAHV